MISIEKITMEQVDKEGRGEQTCMDEVALLFGDVEFNESDRVLERVSHSQRKQEYYMEHQEKYKAKEFQKNKWKERKDRVNKRLEGLTNEEKCSERTKRKEQIKSERENQMKGFQSGVPLIVDCSFDQFMSVKEIKSLAMQIMQTTEAQRRNHFPFQVNVCNASQQLSSYMTSQLFKQLPINMHSQDIFEIEQFRDQAPNMVYLSPDSENDLLEVDSSGKTIYIIGGLIDRSVKKWASFDRATQLKVRTARLPINAYLTDLTRRALNIDTVSIIMALAMQLKSDWKTATLTVLGNKKIKDSLKATQKDLVLSSRDQYEQSILHKNIFLRDALNSIEYKEKHNLQQIILSKEQMNLQEFDQKSSPTSLLTNL